MPYRKSCALLALTLALVAAPVLAEELQRDQHHPVAPAPAAAASTPAMPEGMMAGGQMPGAGDMPMMGMMRTMMGEAGMGMVSEHVEGRIAFLKTELKITDAQLPLWNGFAQAMRDNAKAMQGAMQGMSGGMMGTSEGATLPDKLAARETMLSGRLDTVRKLKGAAEPLYAALSADQKKTADDIMVSPMGMVM